MADDPLDHLISSTLTIEGDEAKQRGPALPFTEPSTPAAIPRSEPMASGAVPAQSWPAPPPYATVGMPSAMPEMLARFTPPGVPQHAPPPRISEEALAAGAASSAYALSNAAAPREQHPLFETRGSLAAPRVATARVDYLWHDTLSEERILRAPSMQKLEPAAELESEWLAPEGGGAADGERAVRAILVERKPSSIEEVARLYEETLDRGEERLFCLVRGELGLSFEPIEALRVALSVATPFLADARVRETYDAAQEALRATTGVAPAIAASHKERLEEAMKAALRTSYPAVESLIDRALIEDRAFSRRKVFGKSFVRGLLHASSATSPASGAVPVYLPQEAAEQLPLMRLVSVRLIVEVRPTQDAVESHPLALRVVALGRVVDLGSRGR